MHFNREQSNILSSWWWTIDRVTLIAVMAIIAIGALMVTTASPAVAERIGLEGFYFVKRQLMFLALALLVIMGVSFLSHKGVRRLSVIGFLITLLCMVAVLFIGMEAKGARRWIYMAGISLQPSEFMKPFFVVMTAWVLAKYASHERYFSYKISALIYTPVAVLLILQPDFGMTVVISAVWGAMLFLAGLPFLWIGIIAIAALMGAIAAYSFLPHVAKRIDSFLDEEGNYQVRKSLEAFNHGGFLGKGPGEGSVKHHLPDSHTDFIFAVVGEEMGAIMGIVIIGLFACVVIRSLYLAWKENDLFVMYAVSGLAIQFGIQSMINIGVTLHLLPTKGMTLPFISYGGSSLIAIALTVGILLSLTRKRFGEELRFMRMG